MGFVSAAGTAMLKKRRTGGVNRFVLAF